LVAVYESLLIKELSGSIPDSRPFSFKSTLVGIKDQSADVDEGS